MSNESIRSSAPKIVDPNEDPLFHFTRVFLKFFQTIFSEREAGDFRWVGTEEGGEDDKHSEISITDESPLPRERSEATPCIVTQRAEVMFADLTMDSMRHVDHRTGSKTRIDLIPGSMLIHCLSKNRVEASRLAWIVTTAIKRWRVLLQRAGFHQVGQGLRIGPPTPPGGLVSPEPAPELRMVTVMCPFTFRWSEEEMPLDAPKAQEYQLRLYGQIDSVGAKKTTNPGIPTWLGVPNGVTMVPLDNVSVDLTLPPGDGEE